LPSHLDMSYASNTQFFGILTKIWSPKTIIYALAAPP
jgi:hypothetical protein